MDEEVDEEDEEEEEEEEEGEIISPTEHTAAVAEDDDDVIGWTAAELSEPEPGGEEDSLGAMDGDLEAASAADADAAETEVQEWPGEG